MNHKILALITASVVMGISLAGVTLADSTIMGNSIISRANVDSFSNFSVIDTNHLSTAAGHVNFFTYWASNTHPFRFIIVDGSNVVKWISAEVIPAATGMNTYAPANPVAVQAGWNLGAYFASTGTIPFDSTGVNAFATNNGAGLPTIGFTLSLNNVGERTYSLAAMQTTLMLHSVNVTPSLITLNIGGIQQLTVTSLDQNSDTFSGATISYASSNPAVATVSSSGLVTGVSAGVATITVSATSGSTTVMGTANVTVSGNMVVHPFGFLPPGLVKFFHKFGILPPGWLKKLFQGRFATR